MVKTIVFLTPHYLNFASVTALKTLHDTCRTVLIADRADVLLDKIESHMSVIIRADGDPHRNIRTLLDHEQCRLVVSDELRKLGGDSSAIRIFCQEECHVELAALLREEFGIEGDTLEVVSNFRDKVRMKGAVNSKGIRIPAFAKLDQARLARDPEGYYTELCAAFGLPLVIKPVNSAGSFEVSIVHDKAGFLTTRDQITASLFHFEYEVDEFINGQMFQCDSFVVDGEVRYCGLLELGCTNFDFVQGKPLSVIPVLDPALKSRLEAFNRDVIAALNFRNGSTHHELFVDHASGEPIFLEIAARVPGGIGVPYHEKNSDINLIDANLYLTAGSEKLNAIQPHSKNNVVSALLPLRKGKISQLNNPPISSEFVIEWKVSPGMVVDSKSLADNAGILTFYNLDPKSLRADFDALQGYQPTQVEAL
ncbi:ATP-grasp domain-containing protein [Pseudomonas syringae]|uniref:ATP-grasp domain-containing protein n=3 Tax=Pseudomonas syringae TaxID=317 RepID=A0A9Q4FF82_PSESX|nr:ATP-grasp domain-containing protein [Pseudomonas syringae]KTB78693.1 biotin carboxylase [Pseudomonas syringae pv. syringae PD2766]MCF5468843.1 ATP-grasp domain-containing protein [Pseudomonas syringae]MCF5472578.1 ATP-grasp domain-containing protein [Pseudomonas syringae]MCF5481568.1 ATP-grasp domain-containing protein [Pseudomonas syringae]MCF5486621.1 ATP-grasp domain-containing protein [Pseudomonas syringae]